MGLGFCNTSGCDLRPEAVVLFLRTGARVKNLTSEEGCLVREDEIEGTFIYP